MQNFVLGIPTCWYLKMLKLALPPLRTLKFALRPTRNPNASQWNIGCVVSPGIRVRVGHVHFMLLCQFRLRRVANVNAVFSGIWDLKSDIFSMSLLHTIWKIHNFLIQL